MTSDIAINRNFTKINSPPWPGSFSRFLNCKNGTKSRKGSQLQICSFIEKIVLRKLHFINGVINKFSLSIFPCLWNIWWKWLLSILDVIDFRCNRQTSMNIFKKMNSFIGDHKRIWIQFTESRCTDGRRDGQDNQSGGQAPTTGSPAQQRSNNTVLFQLENEITLDRHLANYFNSSSWTFAHPCKIVLPGKIGTML